MTATAIRTAPVESSRSSAQHAFGALLLRDVRVLFKEKWIFIGRTIMQPLLLIFVFTYVFPKIGQGIGTNPSAFSTLLVGGTIASAMIFQGVQAVALPLVQDVMTVSADAVPVTAKDRPSARLSAALVRPRFR